MLASRFDWPRRVTWAIGAVFLGAYAARRIVPYEHAAALPMRVWIEMLITLPLVGLVGAIALVARNWRQLGFAVLAGTAAWSFGVVAAIPKNSATCGTDAVGGCDHLLGFWFVFMAIVSVLPIGITLIAATTTFWLLRPSVRTASNPSPLGDGPPATPEQIEWAEFVARGGS